MLPACTVYTLLFGVLFGFLQVRATGRRAAADARTEVRTALNGAGCLTRTRTQTNLARVRTLSLSVFLLLEFYSRLWLFSSIIDHRSSIIDHCLILAFRTHLMLLWPVLTFVLISWNYLLLFRSPATRPALPLCRLTPLATRSPGAGLR